MSANFILVVKMEIPEHKFNIIISKSLCKMFFTNKTVFGYIQILIWNLSNPL